MKSDDEVIRMIKFELKRNRFAAGMLAVLFAVGATACMPERGGIAESVAQSAADAEGPDTAIRNDIVLDFEEAQSSCEELLQDGDYMLGSYVDSYVDEERGIINLIWPLKEMATEADGVVYAEAIIRAFNDACAEQDFSIPMASEESYGGLYGKYAVNVQVFRERDILSPENYLVSMTIPAGSDERVIAFSQYDGVNEVMLSDGPTLIPGGKFSGDIEALQAQFEEAEEDDSSEESEEPEDSEEPEESEQAEESSQAN